MDDAEFLQHVAEWKAMPNFVQEVRDFQSVKTRPYPAELKAAAFRELLARASETQRRRLPYLIEPSDAATDYVADVLCELFLESNSEEQLRLLNSSVAQAFDFAIIRQYIPRIKTKDDIEQLRRGLAATVLLDGRDDYRDILMALADLWVAAAQAGINPFPYFLEAAGKASSEDRGMGSTRDELATFHTYAIFKEQVEPYLPKAFRPE
jgi:hypothetical protein